MGTVIAVSLDSLQLITTVVFEGLLAARCCSSLSPWAGNWLLCFVAPWLPAVPRVVAVSPQMRLVEDNPSSLSLVEIYKQRCAKKGIEHDNPISRYYDRLATVQARGTQASHQVLEHRMSFNEGHFLGTWPQCVQLHPIRQGMEVFHWGGGLHLLFLL